MAGAFPVRLQLILMEVVPLQDVAECTTGKLTLHHTILNGDRDAELPVVGVGMPRLMVAVVHMAITIPRKRPSSGSA